MWHIWQLRVLSRRSTHFNIQIEHYLSHVVFHTVRAGAYRHKIDAFTHAHWPLSRVVLFIYSFIYLFPFPVHSAQAIRLISFTMSDPCLSPGEDDSKLKEEQKSLHPFDDHLYGHRPWKLYFSYNRLFVAT